MTEAETSRPFLEKNHVHELKCHPDPFDALLDGRKTCELRRDDRGYMVGHRLLLREWDQETGYSGRWLFVTVEHIIRAWDWPGIAGGFVVMSIKPGRFEGEPPFDQAPARQDEFRASIAEALGHTHPGMEGQYVMSDRDMLKAILELRANVSEDDRQLAVSRADCSRMYEQRAAARAECLERTEERDVARAECLRLRSVRAELERLVASL